MADTFHDVVSLSDEENLSFLLIGGNAVIALGIERTTLDVDVLIKADDLDAWKTHLGAFGYNIARESKTFAQFRPAAKEGMRLDLMLVDRQTFEKLESASQNVEFGHRIVRVPTPLHLIALKLHALKNPDRAALGKDLADILSLVERYNLDYFSPEFQTVLNRYASPSIRKQLLAIGEAKRGT